MTAFADFSHAPPNATAVIINDKHVNYRHFNRHIDQVRTWLVSQGVSSNNTVGIYCKNPYWMWLLHIAAIRLSCRHLTMLPNYAQTFAEQSGMDVFVGDIEATQVASLDCKKIQFVAGDELFRDKTEVAAGAAEEMSRASARGAERVAFTTGTTGVPKAVLWTADILNARLGQVGESKHLTQSTVLYCGLGMETTAGFRYPLATWRQGGAVLIASNHEWRQKLVQGCSLAVFAPIQIKSELSRSSGLWPRRENRHLILLGGRAHQGLLASCYGRVASSISIAYGSTEAGSVVAGDARQARRHPGACGFVRKDCDVEIIDAKGQQLPPGKRGMVRVRSPSIVAGYFSPQYQSQTAEVFRDGWFYPGDLGTKSADGLVVILGRAADVVNIGGRKLDFSDLEDRLNEVPDITDCCFVKLDTEDEAKVVVLVVTNKDDAWIKQTLLATASELGPISVVRVDSIPRNAMGKIPRNRIAGGLTSAFNKD